MPLKLLKAIMNGRISVDECVDGVLEDATNEPYGDILVAVSPVIKKNITNLKERYNGKREEPIVIARWSVQENTTEDERSQEYPYSNGERRSGDKGNFQSNAEIDRRRSREETHEVVPRHSIRRDSAGRVAKWLDSEKAQLTENGKKPLLEWADKEKALNYLHHSAPIAEALSNPRLISTTNIIQNFQNPKIEAKNSLITPEMDASYLDAVERGDGRRDEIAKRGVCEVVFYNNGTTTYIRQTIFRLCNHF